LVGDHLAGDGKTANLFFTVYCFHQLSGQRFSGENLVSLLARTKRLEKRRSLFLVAYLVDVEDLRPEQYGGGVKVGFTLNKGGKT
jgi:hypothetical protein